MRDPGVVLPIQSSRMDEFSHDLFASRPLFADLSSCASQKLHPRRFLACRVVDLAELNHEQAFVVAMSCPFRPGYGEITEPAQTRCEALDKNGIA